MCIYVNCNNWNIKYSVRNYDFPPIWNIVSQNFSLQYLKWCTSDNLSGMLNRPEVCSQAKDSSLPNKDCCKRQTGPMVKPMVKPWLVARINMNQLMRPSQQIEPTRCSHIVCLSYNQFPVNGQQCWRITEVGLKRLPSVHSYVACLMV